MPIEHERKWVVPFGRVDLEGFDICIIGDLYLGTPAEPLRLRKLLPFRRQSRQDEGPDRIWRMVQPREGDLSNEDHVWRAQQRLDHGGLEVTLKLGSGLSRVELTWTAPPSRVQLTPPEGVKIRREVRTAHGVLSLDRYLVPRHTLFEVLELEGELDAIRSYQPPFEWDAREVTGQVKFGNLALVRGEL